MTDMIRDSVAFPAPRRAYETPVLADLGSVAALTAATKPKGATDGGNNKFKS